MLKRFSLESVRCKMTMIPALSWEKRFYDKLLQYKSNHFACIALLKNYWQYGSFCGSETFQHKACYMLQKISSQNVQSCRKYHSTGFVV